ncbi:PRC-barrel domain-containing protein [Paenibacillus sp. y28]|uniref:PRC-barrel domain-containing protein n=1 Tax=Paenibacillus sp. y28 TaxID=3129110 RepID=UPI003018DC52
MRKAHDIIGLPIIEISGGTQLGIVKDLVIGERLALTHIVVETKQWFSSPKGIPEPHLLSVGPHAVTVQDEEAIMALELPAGSSMLLDGGSKLKGLPVMTVNGQRLGFLQDVYFEEIMGKPITGYELSDGFISDLTEGRKWLPAPGQITVGTDAIIVPLHSEQHLKEIDMSIKPI